ncbi:DUF6364 family protein [Rubrolithibacter danxiaensis]|uniref:DUF6364 family protein n=1 Tax=Rubrolithibacter danxiaensis TaxID=3390805 RepID=UPI003BF7F015
MGNKLTLVLDKNIIEKAKVFASDRNISLSKLVESYLDKVTSNQFPEEEISPLVKDLSGVIKLPQDKNYKKEYSEYLSKKYLNG